LCFSQRLDLIGLPHFPKQTSDPNNRTNLGPKQPNKPRTQTTEQTSDPNKETCQPRWLKDSTLFGVEPDTGNLAGKLGRGRR
jgi:hypothetical protein